MSQVRIANRTGVVLEKEGSCGTEELAFRHDISNRWIRETSEKEGEIIGRNGAVEYRGSEREPDLISSAMTRLVGFQLPHDMSLDGLTFDTLNTEQRSG